MKDKKKRSLGQRIRDTFYPDMIVPSPDAIDYRQLARMGYRIVLLDIDNTLAPHGTRKGDPFARKVVDLVREAGLIPVLASNAKEDRARSFADSLGVAFITDARKPDARAICLDLEGRDCRPAEAVMVGDQLLTDVLSARRGKIPVILTDRRSRSELVTIKAKRVLERILIRLGGKDKFDALRKVTIDQLKEGMSSDCL